MDDETVHTHGGLPPIGAAGGTDRRSADGALAVLLMDVDPREAGASLTPLDPGIFTGSARSPERLARASLLLSIPGDEVVLLPAMDARLVPHGEDAEDLRRRAAAAAAAWRRDRVRLERRLRAPDWIMAYVDHLHAASSVDDVCAALIECAPLVVGACTALVLEHPRARADGGLRVLREARGTLSLPSLPAAAASAFSGPGVISDVEARSATIGAPGALVALFDAFAAAQLFCSPIAAGLSLCLVERRRDRVFTAEDRDMLQWVVEQARRGIARARSEQDEPG